MTFSQWLLSIIFLHLHAIRSWALQLWAKLNRWGLWTGALDPLVIQASKPLVIPHKTISSMELYTEVPMEIFSYIEAMEVQKKVTFLDVFCGIRTTYCRYDACRVSVFVQFFLVGV